MGKLFGFLVILLVLSVCVSNLSARTWYIKPDGTGDAPNIQAGIDSAATADTVILASGTYTGIGNRNIDFEGKAITVTSDHGAEETIIDCETLGRGFIFQNGEGSSSVLTGVTIQNAHSVGVYGHEGGGILCRNSGPTISNNILRNNHTSRQGGGICCWESGSPTISNNIIIGNSATQGGGGIFCLSNAPTIIDNILVENITSGGWGGGIYCANASPTIINNILIRNSAPNLQYGRGGGIALYASSPTISNNTLSENASPNGGGIYLKHYYSYIENTIEKTIIVFSTQGGAVSCITVSPILTCCDVYGNIGGDWAGCLEGQYGIDGNISEDPLFCDPGNMNFYLCSNSTCLHGECGQIGALGRGCFGLSPWIMSITDIRNDQGSRVRIIWERSRYDAAGDTTTITGYGIYRQQDQYLNAPRMNSTLPPRNPPWSRTTQLAGWDYVAAVPARGDSVYQFVAPSLCDSTVTQGICWSVFFVSAMTPDPLAYYDSPIDSGYSVDNLIPHIPTGFFGVGIIEGSPPLGLKLSWDANRDPDISHYSLYKGLSEDFVPDVSNYLGSTDGNSYFDESWTILDQYHYKLAAVDNRGNVSSYSLLRPAEIAIGVLLQSYNASYKGSVIEVTWTLKSTLEQSIQHILRASDQKEEFTEISKPIIIQNDLTYTFRDEDIEPGVPYKYRVEIEGDTGERMHLFETGDIATPKLPLTLFQNVPNPFNPSTTITYYLPEKCSVTLEIFDSSGRLISTLLDNEAREKGMDSIEWRGTDEHGRVVTSGVYFYRLIAGKEIISKKMVLLK